MGGGLMQLVAYGAQDIYLTGNPQITFFKVIFRRHTNFAMECVQQTIDGTVAANSSVSCTISRNGDLLYKLYITSNNSSCTNGSAIVSQAEVEIGGQRIDKHTAEWMQIWNELSTPESKAHGLKIMQGDEGTVGLTGVGRINVPLQFWFCRNPGLALPLIALQYHEVKIKITLGATNTGADGAELWADYIYLDTDERRRFAQMSHEYLIEQIQIQSASASVTNKLIFNHPVKELIWTSNDVSNDYLTAQLKLNGHDRFVPQEEEYFQLRQPYDYHTAIPQQNYPNELYSSITLSTNTKESSQLDVSGSKIFIESLGNNMMVQFTLNNNNNDTDKIDVGDLVAFRNTDPSKAAKSLLVMITRISDKRINLNSGLTGTMYRGKIIASGNVGLSVQAMPDDGDTLEVTLTKGISVPSTARTSKLSKRINCYSFALKPEEHQPSGTCNFSRIDNAQLVTGVQLNSDDNIYAVNYNILRIMSGMGGLAYSN